MASRRDSLSREVSSGKWRAIISLLASGWLEPVEADDLFELYALTVCLEAISGDLGFGAPQELGLVIRHRKYVARFLSIDGVSIEVFFDQSPSSSIGRLGRYADVIGAHHGLSGSARRPDITIVRTLADGTKRVVFVEVKRTQSREYLSDSVYKAFGYLFDYAGLWNVGDILPKVILFVPEAVHLKPGASSDVVFVSGTDLPSISAVLGRALLSSC